MDDNTSIGLRVLVTTDGSAESNAVLPYAETLMADGGSITLLSVLPTPSLGLLIAGLPFVDLAGLKREARKQMTSDLRDLADAVSDRLPDTSVSIAIEQGDPAAVIVQVAADRDVDLIVMRTHGRGMMGRLTFGSVADRVSRTASVPVLLVHNVETGTGRFTGFHRILTLLDASGPSARSIPVVERLGIALDLPVALLTVIDEGIAYDPLLSFATLGGGQVYPDIIRAVREEASAAQEAAAATLEAAGIAVERLLIERAVLPGVLEVIHPGDLVVLTSHGRSGLRRWVLGSVAEKVVRSVPAPVLLVRLPTPQAEELVASAREPVSVLADPIVIAVSY